ncbi:unnamed protein product [Dibothriocephalus latus]|uniref:Uncharacterized protein n=1 Tax=Dibothriocephalus latus TaxID=60516 RepID=A0A3P7MNW8_DIBLA|nr:unnamed protein product [Dibothriocephalus latus]
MIIPKFVVVLLLLGHTYAGPMKFQIDVKKNEPFVFKFDAGAKVEDKTLKLDEKDLALCKENAKTEAADVIKDCYKQSVDVKVNFVLTGLNGQTTVKFTPEKIYKIEVAAMTGEDKGPNAPAANDATCKKGKGSNCLTVVSEANPVDVTVDMKEAPRTLTLADKIAVTFNPKTGSGAGGAAIEVSLSAALILVNMALLYLTH